MTELHPVHVLEGKLQAARLEVIEALATTEVALSGDKLRDLAIIQAEFRQIPNLAGIAEATSSRFG
jgi:hypothetical protein